MNSYIMLRLVAALIYGGTCAYRIINRDRIRLPFEEELDPRKKYGAVIPPSLILIFFLLLGAIALLDNTRITLNSALPLLFGIILNISIFFLILILVLPLIRKYISAKTVAVLWLLPNFLYLTLYNYMTLDKPRLIVDIGRIPLQMAAFVWIIVASAVFAYYLIGHFVFRFRLLHNAKNLEDAKIRQLWENMQGIYGIKKRNIKIKISENTTTPLSIGLWSITTVLVLPHTNYTEEELKLIFKHELIHIIREDSSAKLFIAMCNAFCWFNPLMWVAMKKCTEDLELSCDEFVLEDTNKADKELYGNLILSTAGNEAGFTTCLSANANALKYRLTNIYRPKRKFSGGIFAGIAMAIMLITSGFIALSYNHQTTADVFNANVGSISEGSRWSLEKNNKFSFYECTDPKALDDYLMNLKICDVTGNYDNRFSDNEFYCHYETSEGLVIITLNDSELRYSPLYTAGRKDAHTYQLEEPVDWDYIESMLIQENKDNATY